MQRLAGNLSKMINWWVERIIAALMFVLVLDVWIGVVDRYLFHWQLPWPEVVARYLMIWMALLAISAGIARREHIGLSILTSRIPHLFRRPMAVGTECITLVMFLAIAWYGIDFADKGARKFAHIFGMSLYWPYMALPVAMGIAALQTLLTAMRDLGDYSEFDSAEFIE